VKKPQVRRLSGRDKPQTAVAGASSSRAAVSNSPERLQRDTLPASRTPVGWVCTRVVPTSYRFPRAPAISGSHRARGSYTYCVRVLSLSQGDAREPSAAAFPRTLVRAHNFYVRTARPRKESESRSTLIYNNNNNTIQLTGTPRHRTSTTIYILYTYTRPPICCLENYLKR
jgi:hypothetical protein